MTQSEQSDAPHWYRPGDHVTWNGVEFVCTDAGKVVGSRPDPHHWPNLVVTHWRPAVAGLEALGYVQPSVTLYPFVSRAGQRGQATALALGPSPTVGADPDAEPRTAQPLRPGSSTAN